MERTRRTTRADGFSYACDPVEGILAQPHTSTNVVKIKKIFKNNKNDDKIICILT